MEVFTYLHWQKRRDFFLMTELQFGVREHLQKGTSELGKNFLTFRSVSQPNVVSSLS